jgi:hypothetical protein
MSPACRAGPAATTATAVDVTCARLTSLSCARHARAGATTAVTRRPATAAASVALVCAS